MQYVVCKFREYDIRTYTYHNDGEPVQPGDYVKVADARSDGWKRVQVVSITSDTPSFPTKPILGKITGEDTDSAILDRALGSDVTFN